VDTEEFNGAGYRTAYDYSQAVVTKAEFNADKTYIKITGKEQRLSYKYAYAYDGKNRITLQERTGYSYNAYLGGSQVYSYYGVGDSMYYYGGNTSLPFELREDTTVTKTEVTYDEAAKTATAIEYELEDGVWEEQEKTIYTLNAYGYVDDNSSSQSYSVKSKAAEFETKPDYIYYKEVDAAGNWTLRYTYYSGSSNASDYSTRVITY
jgi:hypothetical protein